MSVTLKTEAHRLIDTLPDEATWEDLMYRLYVRQAIEQGLADSDADRVISADEARARLGLTGAPRTGDA